MMPRVIMVAIGAAGVLCFLASLAWEAWKLDWNRD